MMGQNMHPVELPDNIDTLKALVEEKEVEIDKERSEKERYKAKLAFLEEQIRLMRHKQFGASSEKVTPQENLFNESELEALEPVEEEDISAEVVTPTT
ncbi:MAG: hypothetical protein GY696_13355, partial [Gammaproteobacteria bacterium]|nr:hypothetical protein [Gammaproteobacteria bacterium]